MLQVFEHAVLINTALCVVKLGSHYISAFVVMGFHLKQKQRKYPQGDANDRRKNDICTVLCNCIFNKHLTLIFFKLTSVEIGDIIPLLQLGQLFLKIMNQLLSKGKLFSLSVTFINTFLRYNSKEQFTFSQDTELRSVSACL